LNTIKFWVEHFNSKNADVALRKIEYRIGRIKLLMKRLEMVRLLNTVENIKKFGYRSYWIKPETHGEREESKYG
jgi:hypothetical protein